MNSFSERWNKAFDLIEKKGVKAIDITKMIDMEPLYGYRLEWGNGQWYEGSGSKDLVLGTLEMRASDEYKFEFR